MLRNMMKQIHLRPSAIPRLEALEARVAPAVLPPGFTEIAVASGVARATAMELAPDGKLFVASQTGTMAVWQSGNKLQDNFFADTPRTVDSSGERGLLGIAFHPNYLTNRFVYVYYTTIAADHHNRVSRFTANAAGDRALAGSEIVIWEGDPHSATNHNGGAIHFGPDGKLYIATGDNANGSNSQSLTSLHGKILRLNDDGGIPANNPFVGQTSGRFLAIWALGLRNPFTFSFESGGAQMFINDVGQANWEEIDAGSPGANYGWPGVEGPAGTPPSGPGTYRGPVHAYLHGGNPRAIAITGGAFYNPISNPFGPAFRHDYFFADFGAGWIRRLDFNPATGQYSPNALPFASGLNLPVDLKVDDAGRLYYLTFDGTVFRISKPPSVVIVQQPGDFTAASGRPAVFIAAAVGANLQYQWQRADSGSPGNWVNIPGATARGYILPVARPGDNGDFFRLVAFNAGGVAVSRAARLTVTPPLAPVHVLATAGGERVSVRWSGSPLAIGYNVYRGTASGGETLVASNVPVPLFIDSGLAAGTRYFYQVTAVNALGEGPRSVEVSTIALHLVRAINAGGGAAGAFQGDASFVGGTIGGTGIPSNASRVGDPAPQGVYQNWRAGNFWYVVNGLTPGANYVLRLHFAEAVAVAFGQRLFHVAANGGLLLGNFDILREAGGRFRAITRQFNVRADASGRIVLQFVTVAGAAQVNGIEVLQ